MGTLASLPRVPHYHTTRAFAYLVAAQTVALGVAAALLTWQAARMALDRNLGGRLVRAAGA